MNLTKPIESLAICDPFEDFKNNWIENPQFLTPYHAPITVDNQIWGVSLYRQNEYQVQLFIFGPNTIIPPHRHPNVDSFEVYLSGDIEFDVGGEVVMEMSEHADPAQEHYNFCMGRCVRVLPSAWHSARSGPRGGSFMSIQRWLNGVTPTNVGDDWDRQGNEERRNFKIEA